MLCVNKEAQWLLETDSPYAPARQYKPGCVQTERECFQSCIAEALRLVLHQKRTSATAKSETSGKESFRMAEAEYIQDLNGSELFV